MLETVITKPIYRILTDLTREERVEVALPLAMKDWVRLRLRETQQQRRQFEQLCGMDFTAFKRDWHEGRVPDAHVSQPASRHRHRRLHRRLLQRANRHAGLRRDP